MDKEKDTQGSLISILKKEIIACWSGMKPYFIGDFLCITGFCVGYFSLKYFNFPILVQVLLMLIATLAGMYGISAIFMTVMFLFGITTQLIEITFNHIFKKKEPKPIGKITMNEEQPTPVDKPKNTKKKVFLAVSAICAAVVIFLGGMYYGNEQGYNTGYEAGHDDAYHSGYDAGYKHGKTAGYKDGNIYGYNKGYSDGKADAVSHDLRPDNRPKIDLTPEPEYESVTVYVTDYGSKYHRSGCQYLWDSCIPIDLEDAKDQGYTPCSKCNPPW